MLKTNQHHKTSQQRDTRPTLDTKIAKSLTEMSIYIGNFSSQEQEKPRSNPVKKPAHG